ncbi:hypothetical protein [Amycolatopsis methanolica]|uniref:hypothetical protein n=1 Tax=Amycolatopsis methanolica TaxID=1814 RepID=UPI003F4E3100
MTAARLLATAQLVNSLGDGAYYVTSALYFTLVIGLPSAQVGLGLTLGWAAGAVAGVGTGHLADRYGPRCVAIARMAGPVLLTTLVLGGGAVGWLVLGALFLLTGLGFAPVTRWRLASAYRNGLPALGRAPRTFLASGPDRSTANEESRRQDSWRATKRSPIWDPARSRSTPSTTRASR